MKKSIIFIIIVVILVSIFYLYVTREKSNKTIVGAIEDLRTQNYVEYIIHEDYLADGAFVYYLRNMYKESPVLSVEYVEKTLNGKWKWVYGGGHSGTHLSLVEDYNEKGTPFSYQFLQVTEDKPHRIPYPLIFGGLSDPTVNRIVIRDYNTGLERQANMVRISDRFRLYYVYLSESQGKKFDIIAYNGQGEITHTETIDGNLLSSGNSGTNIED